MVAPFDLSHGYTMVFNDDKTIGLTLNKESSKRIAHKAKEYMNIPEESIQNPIVTLAPNDLVGIISRMRPFLGQLGTLPSIPIPDSHNAGDFAQALIGATHDYAITKEELSHITDGHMDIERVREGAIVICPVKVKGGGVYIGDMHAMQGNGEIAGHTTDVSGIVHLEVQVIKNLKLDGPILLPNEEDLPFIAKPFSEKEKGEAKRLAKKWDVSKIEESYPLSFIGTGANLNEATDNGLKRAADLFEVTVPEIMNRATITGSIDVGRHPGVVTVTLLVPRAYLEKINIFNIVKNYYSK